ncbi:MAG: RNA-binding S4 domain-containing protein [Betaproteobacteria bacterium]|nr:RNA-binding S4 domain-containing protein [Betaproteobacteria bacterium]
MAKTAPAQESDGDKHRLDKWLWAARFFKTRSLSAQAVESGKVTLNGERVKPAKSVKVGDMLMVKAGSSEFTLRVEALSDRRGSASVAALLYAETAESRAKREHQAALRKANPLPVFTFKGRPTKRDRRQLEKFQGPEDE